MKLGSRQRWLILLLLLGGVIGAAVRVSDPDRVVADDAVVQPEKPHANKQRDKQSRQESDEQTLLNLEKLKGDGIAAAEQNSFAPKSWYVPPPPPKPTTLMAPAPPSAPSLPFVYLGKFEEEGGKLVVYLIKGEQPFIVGKGQTFDSVYRLEGIENGSLVIMYLPLSIKQSLPLAAAS